MNMIFLGMFLIVVGVSFACLGITTELDNKPTIKKGENFVTVDKGVLLKKYTLEDVSFADGTPGPVCVVGYVEKMSDNYVETDVSSVNELSEGIKND